MPESITTLFSTLAEPSVWFVITAINALTCTFVIGSVASRLRRARALAAETATAVSHGGRFATAPGFFPDIEGRHRRRRLQTLRRITLWVLTLSAVTVAIAAGYQAWTIRQEPPPAAPAVVQPAVVVPTADALPPPPRADVPSTVPAPALPPQALAGPRGNTLVSPSGEIVPALPPLPTAAPSPSEQSTTDADTAQQKPEPETTRKKTSTKKRKKAKRKRRAKKRSPARPAKRRDTFEDL